MDFELSKRCEVSYDIERRIVRIISSMERGITSKISRGIRMRETGRRIDGK